MTQLDPTTDTRGPARSTVRYRGRHLPMVAVVVAATIATALAYSGMVLFGLEVAGMSPAEAYALAGFLEVSLVAVALMARNAALEGRPYGVLLTLTWILSGTSGMFAALHEIAVPDASTPYMVAFRFVPPLVAALMWHLALVGERHLVTGHTLDERRREHRVHQYVTALELWRDARLDSGGTHRGMRKVRAAHGRQRAARDAALKLLTVEDFERRMQVWVERLEAAERHGSRLDVIGASSVERGVARGAAVDGPRTVPAIAAPVASDVAPRADAEPVVVRSADEAAADGASDAFADDLQAALTGATPVVEDERRPGTADDESVRAWFDDLDGDLAEDLGSDPAQEPGVDGGAVDGTPVDGAAKDGGAVDGAAKDGGAVDGAAKDGGTVDEAEDRGVVADDVPAPAEAEVEAGLPGTREPLPETGHTRRVEVFDLLRQSDPALGGALAQRSAFLTAHGEATEEAATADAQLDVSPPATPQAPTVPAEEPPATTADAQPEDRGDRDRRIVELADDGLSHREIAERFDVSRATVSRVVKRYATV
ncbi:helix-turn-helix domain-containing protein [Isoptericola sp. NPDC019693]|uniref:helix-turn-helix domain-containing protein n=1 Tax=Isoptericola sp. NPDC019693 TaxID=3364009 RepID=UPI0037A6004A